MAMVRVGNKMYDQNQMFDVNIDSVVGPVKLNAVQMARFLDTGGSGGQGATPYSMGNTSSAGMLQDYKVSGEVIQEKAPAAPAPAPAPRRSAPRSQLTAPPAVRPLREVNDAITPEEKEEITKPASGLEDTIKTSPVLLRERRRRSYLTAGR